MTIAWIRSAYGVPAKRGARVEYSGCAPARLGNITGTQGSHLLIRMDGDKHSQPYHPTWMIRYLDAETAEPSLAPLATQENSPADYADAGPGLVVADQHAAANTLATSSKTDSGGRK